MTDNEIIKALNTAADKDFVKVYLWDDKPQKVTTISVADIADLINRQKAEIDELQGEVNKQYEIAEASVRAEIASGGTSCHWCEYKVRAEAIKEFAERLKEYREIVSYDRDFDAYVYGSHIHIDIDEFENLVKEIAGEQ